MRKIHKNCAILIPTFNDWQSLNKLISKINNNARKIARNVNIYVVNDGSTKKQELKVKKLKKLKKIKIINLKKNLGSQISISLGLNQLKKMKINSDIIVMDSDGEDNPNKIPLMLSLLKDNQDKIIVASRAQRKETFFLKFLNMIRLILTFLLTGKYMNYGNFSAFKSNKLKNFSESKDLLLAYCAGITRNMSILKTPINKEFRYFEKSKVNFTFLFFYSLRILSIYRYNVLINSLIIIFLSIYIDKYFLDITNLINMISFSLIFLNIIIFYLYIFEKSIFFYKKFIKSVINIK